MSSRSKHLHEISLGVTRGGIWNNFPLLFYLIHMLWIKYIGIIAAWQDGLAFCDDRDHWVKVVQGNKITTRPLVWKKAFFNSLTSKKGGLLLLCIFVILWVLHPLEQFQIKEPPFLTHSQRDFNAIYLSILTFLPSCPKTWFYCFTVIVAIRPPEFQKSSKQKTSFLKAVKFLVAKIFILFWLRWFECSNFFFFFCDFLDIFFYNKLKFIH